MQSLKTIEDAVEPKGYNDKLIDHSIPDGFCVLAQNCWLDNNQIQERTGYSQLGTDTGENKPNLGFWAYETQSVKQILKINDNAAGTAANLFYWNGTTWTKVLTPTFSPGVKCCITTAQGYAYIANGVDVTKKWDGVTLVDVPGIVIAPIIVWFHNYLFAIKNTTVYWSQTSNPDVFPVSSLMDINPSDGDTFIGASTLKDELILCKRFRTYSFQGWLETAFSYTQVNEKLASYGATSQDAFSNIGNDLLFLSFSGDIPHIRSLARTKEADTAYGGIITDAIEGTMRGLSKGQLSKAAAVFDGRKAWFFMPSGSSTFNDIATVFDTITLGHTKVTGVYAARATISTITGQAKIYFADSRNSKVYIFDGSYDDDGADIEMIYLSKRFQPDFKRLFKFKYLFAQYHRDGTGTLQVLTSVDDHEFELQETLSLQTPQQAFPYVFPLPFGITTQENIRIELPYQPVSNIQMKLYKKDQTAPSILHDYAFMGYPKAIRDLP